MRLTAIIVTLTPLFALTFIVYMLMMNPSHTTPSSQIIHDTHASATTDHVYQIHADTGDISVHYHHAIDANTLNQYIALWSTAITKDNTPLVCTQPLQDTYRTTTEGYTATAHTMIPNDRHAQLIACAHLTTWNNIADHPDPNTMHTTQAVIMATLFCVVLTGMAYFFM